jgi:integrase
MATHTIFGGKVHLYKRPNSRFWQCSTYLAGRNRRETTKQESLQLAKEFAEDWYLTLRDKSRQGELLSEKTFKQAAEQFEREYEIITEGQRSPRWVEGHKARLRLHLIPFFGSLGLSQVTAGKVQEYRMHRMTPSDEPNPHARDNRPHTGKPPSRSTLHDEIVTLRQVLKTASRHGWLDRLPDLSPPYKTQGKISHRAWFSHKEYKQLYTATRKRAGKPKHPAYKWHAEQMHDYVLFMANTGLRPDEAKNLQHRDVEIVTDDWSGDKILEIEVRGKRGVGYCMSTPGAVRPYERLRDRPKPAEENGDDAPPESVLPEPTDPVFPGNHIKMFNNVLSEEKLKFDRDGNRRTAYSLRHTYICFRLMEGADIYQIAKNCRTSVEMIEKHYAAHIKTALDTSAINIRKERPRPANEQPRRGKRAKSGEAQREEARL